MVLQVNHFPASFHLGRKDRLWHNLSKMQMRFGQKEFGFFPRTYVLPADIAMLKHVWNGSISGQKWIIKPVSCVLLYNIPLSFNFSNADGIVTFLFEFLCHIFSRKCRIFITVDCRMKLMLC